jgi:preprotein translocase subunit SecD
MMQRRPVRKGPRIGRNAWALLLIVVLLGVSVWLLSPLGSDVLHRDEGDLGLRLGLDLKGGTHLVYQAEFADNTTADERAMQMEGAINSIRKRIDTYGVVEPIIQQQGDDRILIQLPGITDVQQAKALIEQTAFLEFRELELKTDGTTPVTLKDYLSDNRTGFFDTGVPGNRAFYLTATEAMPLNPVVFLKLSEETPNTLVFVDRDGNPVDPATLTDVESAQCWMPSIGEIEKNGVQTKVPLTGSYLSKAAVAYNTSQVGTTEVVVAIEWDGEGTIIFDQIAARLYPDRERLAIILDDELISAPTINSENYGGKAQISGNFDVDTARTLAIQLNSGALPIALKKPPLYEKNISATLGEDFVNRAFMAALIGLGIVAFFMMLYYRLPGVVSVMALLIYTALVLMIYKAIPVTLTLAGVAGFIVSLGMAVDANVLIFERMKEELRGGRTLKAGIEAGFSRAWPAIRDSNITTFIACGILYWFGSSIVASSAVTGFAVTLFIGVAVSMFSAIVITRTLLLVATGWRFTRRLSLFGVEARSVQPGS